MVGIIYKRTAPNGKIYIGQTVNEKRRQHEWYCKSRYSGGSNPHLEAARRKYGPDSFSYAVLETLTADSSIVTDWLNEREIYWIAYFSSNDKSKGYNLTTGGNGCNGYKHTEFTRAKIAASHKGKPRISRYAGYGAVREYNEYGDIVRVADIHTLTRKGKSGKQILCSCQSGIWLGYRTFRFVSDDILTVTPLVPRNKIQLEMAKIDIYSVDTGILEKSFRFMRDCAKYLNGKEREVSKCLRGVKPQYKGYVIVRHGVTASVSAEAKQAYEWYKLYGRTNTQ